VVGAMEDFVVELSAVCVENVDVGDVFIAGLSGTGDTVEKKKSLMFIII
jgi:hypothetical protein